MEPTKAALIPPGIGRICHFVRFDPATREHFSLPQAALVTAVHNDRCISCQVFGADGRNSHYCKIDLVQPGDVAPDADYCRWMEYQVGQAQKTAELQEQLDRVSPEPAASADGELVPVDNPIKSGV